MLFIDSMYEGHSLNLLLGCFCIEHSKQHILGSLDIPVRKRGCCFKDTPRAECAALWPTVCAVWEIDTRFHVKGCGTTGRPSHEKIPKKTFKCKTGL